MNWLDLWSVIVGFFKTIEFTDVLDIAIVAFLVYKLLTFISNSVTVRIIRGVLIFILALWLSEMLQLHSLNYLMTHFLEWGVIAILVLFQPEIRRMLERLGENSLGITKFSFLRRIFGNVVEQPKIVSNIDQVVDACKLMSETKTGALIVFEMKDKLDDVINTGTKIDAEVSSELLRNIFFVKAPLHDGALIIRDGRVFAAGCTLPLSRNTKLSRDLGMRHKAGIGISENSDAVVVIVSEENGFISCANGGMLKRHLTPEYLHKILSNELLPKEEETPQKFTFDSLKHAIKGKKEATSNEK